MAFTNTTLSITPLLETTFISDMRIIVNSNVTVLRSKLEDVINTLQIDLVNKYIGSDLPIGLIRSNNVIVTNQLQLKDGTSSAANTIASLTQSAGTSTFFAHNLQFTSTLKATANSSRAAIKTAVIGGTSGSVDLSFPTSAGAGIPDPGLYVGDPATPVRANFYGNVSFAKSAITQSSTGTVARQLQGTRVSTNVYASLTLAKTDPQYLVVDVKLNDTAQVSSHPIFLQLHENYTSEDSRPEVGQSFTVIFRNIIDGQNADVPYSSWPAIQGANSSITNSGISIMPGWKNDASAGTGSRKPGYINNFSWTTGFPSSESDAITKIKGSSDFSDRSLARFFSQNDWQFGNLPMKYGSSITLTKIEQTATYSRYVVTGGSNYNLIHA